MQESSSTRYSISYHTKDLLKRDLSVIREVCSYLEGTAEKDRDRTRRTGSKRMMARLIAAKELLRALDDPQTAREVKDRTEGKVADKLITVDMNELVKQLESARQRVLNRGNTDQQRISEGQASDRLHMSSYQTHGILTRTPEDTHEQAVLGDVAEDALPVRPPTNTLGSHDVPLATVLLSEHTGSEMEKESCVDSLQGSVVEKKVEQEEATTSVVGSEIVEGHTR